ncbi:ARPP-1 family domain-containing protein [Pseudonocardia alni]|uniref:ARPP-1 family domain-containing protein n=1 Tax=Pseudonocardia alni TaxID=33907 RepID=UPI0033229F3E
MDLHVGNPVVRGALTLFPVFNGGAVRGRGYDLGGGSLRVAERAGTPVVDQLVVTNRGPRPALLTEGELLTGGWQNRVVTRSVLVGAGRSAVVAVRCVEAQRWSGGTGHARDGERAPVAVRAATADQAAVWRRVAGYGAGATGSFQDAARDRRARARRLVGDLAPLPFQSGVLAGVAGRPLLLEVFDSPRTLAAAWDGLVAGIAVDAVGADPVVTPGHRARRFVAQLAAVPTAPVSGGGEGTAFAGATAAARLSSLSWRGRAVVTVATNPAHPLVVAA